MVKDGQVLKQLSTQLEKAKGDAAAMKVEIAALNKEYKLKLDRVEELEKKLKAISQRQQPAVTEHALVRYFERVLGYDLRQIEATILNSQIIQCMEVLGGNGEYPLGDTGKVVVVKNFTVVTIK